jgi:hypothetical protein
MQNSFNVANIYFMPIMSKEIHIGNILCICVIIIGRKQSIKLKDEHTKYVGFKKANKNPTFVNSRGLVKPFVCVN